MKKGLCFVKELTALDNLNLDAVLKNEMLENGFFSNNLFSFIGIYSSLKTGITVVGYPKYLPAADKTNQSEVLRHVELICKAAARAVYKSKNTSYIFNPHIAQPHNKDVTPYELANFILQDYIEYGLFSEKYRIFETNSRNNINWNRTISKLIPIIDCEPVFLKVITQRLNRSSVQIITPLHAWIVNQCTTLLQTLGEYTNIELPPVTEGFNDDELEHYIPYLVSKMSYIFAERELRLFKALIAWCGQGRFWRYCFGVTAFEFLWEFTAKQVFGNIDYTRFGSPSYYINGKRYEGAGSAIPDILRVFSDASENKKYICILDAKYYYPKIDNARSSIYKAPANADVSKQISYYRYLRQLYSEENILFSNVFLLPKFTGNFDNLYKVIGYVENNNQRNHEIMKLLNVDMNENGILDKVIICQINPDKLFNVFLKGEKINNNDIINDFIAPFHA